MSSSIKESVFGWLCLFVVLGVIFGTCEGIDAYKKWSTEKIVNSHLKNVDVGNIKNGIVNLNLKSRPVIDDIVPKGKTIAFLLDENNSLALYYDVNKELQERGLLAESLQECKSIYVQVDNKKYMGEFKYTEYGRKTLPTKVTHHWTADCFIDAKSFRLLLKDEPPNTNPTSVRTKGGNPETYSGVLHSADIAIDRIINKIQ